MDALAEAQARTEQRLAELAERQARVEERLVELAERQERTENQLFKLTQIVEALVVDVGRLNDDSLELRYARRAAAYFSRIAKRLRVLDTSDLANILDDAVEEGRLTVEERDAVMETDLVATGRRVKDQAEIYLLAEISWGLGPHDVERAADRAAFLAKLGREVVPIAAGVSVDAETLALAGERGVRTVRNGHNARPSSS
ncbi:MAG: hypothetical protein QOF51_3226 [Chloroflexota bacterium]|jgi:hypothetical protein|nr:hypothetical protein [Chloroflexota bacterium]